MSYDTEHYYAVQTFLEDDELHKIWNIIEIAMEALYAPVNCIWNFFSLTLWYMVDVIG